MSYIIKCEICDEELDIPKIICPICSNELKFIDNELLNFLTVQYSNYKNKIIQYNKNEYYDTYKTKAIKNTKIEVFNEIVGILEFALSQYTDIDTSKIIIEEKYVQKPRMCDNDRNKICNGCMDC